MKILALNSSARTGGQSKTEWMLNKLVQGMTEAGAEVEVVNLHEKKVNYCIGCFTCWTKTPGECLHKDDMSAELFGKWRDADMVVYASPLFHYTVNAEMKTFIERTLPFAEPFMVKRDGLMSHPARFTPPKAVVLSVAGFPDPEVFEQLSIYSRFLFGKIGGLAAELYRPGAEMLGMDFIKEQTNAVYEATIAAGRELVESGSVSDAIMEAVAQPLLEPDVMATAANMFWRSAIHQGMTPKAFANKGLAPRPENIEEYLLMMKMGFNPPGADGLQAVFQFDFSGEAEGSCHFSIADGSIETAAGPAAQPDITITAPFEVWVDVITGKADGQQMFMEGKYTAAGDASLLLRMGQLFGAGK